MDAYTAGWLAGTGYTLAGVVLGAVIVWLHDWLYDRYQ